MNVCFTDKTSAQSHARNSGRLSDHMQRLHEPSSLTIVYIASQLDTGLPLVLARPMLSVSHSHQAILPGSTTCLGDYTAADTAVHDASLRRCCWFWLSHLLQLAFDSKFLLGIALAYNLHHGREV